MTRLRTPVVGLACLASILVASSCGGRAPEAPAQAGKGTLLVDKLPDNVEGLELRDGAVYLKKGYRLEPDTATTVAMIDEGGGKKGGLGCGCKSPTGTCVPALEGGIAVCKSDGCEKCGLAVITIDGSTIELATF